MRSHLSRKDLIREIERLRIEVESLKIPLHVEKESFWIIERKYRGKYKTRNEIWEPAINAVWHVNPGLTRGMLNSVAYEYRVSELVRKDGEQRIVERL